MKSISRKKGQVMLLTVLVLSAMVLSITVIAGLITFYTLRNAGSAVHSVRAIYAAEAGLELELFRWYQDTTACHGNPPPSAPPGTPANTPWIPSPYPKTSACYAVLAPLSPLENEATFTTEVWYRNVDVGGITIATIDRIKATGQSGGAARALQANF